MSSTPKEGGDDLLETFDAGGDMDEYFDFGHPESPNRAAGSQGCTKAEEPATKPPAAV